MYINGSIFGTKNTRDRAGKRIFRPTRKLTVETPNHKNISTTSSTKGKDEPVWWVLGNIYGFDQTALDGEQLYGQPSYTQRPTATNPASYCAYLYDQYGIDFVRGLNGNFFIIGYDPLKQQVAAVTDRLTTVPVYYTPSTQTGDSIIFSSNIQYIPTNPSVETAYDPTYLHEYLAYKRTFGVKTPLEGIEEFQPGSITLFDLTDKTYDVEQYWTPQFQPVNQPFGTFVDEFVRQFTTILDEWIDPEQRYGVLASGGSDSRLILAALDGDVTAFHMADWMNREARIAKRVAAISGAEFTVLQRGANYRTESLERNCSVANFNGWFTQPYTSGFDDELTNSVDGLLSGLYGDILFKGFSIPSPCLSVGTLGNLTLPIEHRLETIDEYIEWLLDRAFVTDSLDLSTDLRSILEENIYRDGDQIIHHGVAYDSLQDLVHYSACYPLSNDDDMIFQTALQRNHTYRSPFLDNRMLDFSLSIPIRYRLRKNIINRAVDRLDSSLAAIPHSTTGVALTHSFPIEYLSRNLTAFCRAHLVDEVPPEPYMTNGSWINDAELLRHHPFFEAALEKYGDLADGLPGIDQETIEAYYEEHLEGENRLVELYTLMTVLSMPVTTHLVSESSPTDPLSKSTSTQKR